MVHEALVDEACRGYAEAMQGTMPAEVEMTLPESTIYPGYWYLRGPDLDRLRKAGLVRCAPFAFGITLSTRQARDLAKRAHKRKGIPLFLDTDLAECSACGEKHPRREMTFGAHPCLAGIEGEFAPMWLCRSCDQDAAEDCGAVQRCRSRTDGSEAPQHPEGEQPA